MPLAEAEGQNAECRMQGIAPRQCIGRFAPIIIIPSTIKQPSTTISSITRLSVGEMRCTLNGSTGDVNGAARIQSQKDAIQLISDLDLTETLTPVDYSKGVIPSMTTTTPIPCQTWLSGRSQPFGKASSSDQPSNSSWRKASHDEML